MLGIPSFKHTDSMGIPPNHNPRLPTQIPASTGVGRGHLNHSQYPIWGGGQTAYPFILQGIWVILPTDPLVAKRMNSDPNVVTSILVNNGEELSMDAASILC